MRILVVDDDAIYCSLVSKKLSSLGGEPCEALDGLAAWQLAQEEEFDLALIDLGLPGLDGLSLIERLRNYPKTQQLPIVVVTGRDDRDTIDSAFGAGATLFLTKPINWSLLSYQINCVMRLTRSEQDAREAHQRARAESRIKDTVIGRLNRSLRPMARDLGACARDLAALTINGADAKALMSQSSALLVHANRLESGLANMAAFAEAISTNLEMHSTNAPMSAVVTAVVQSALARAAARNVMFKTQLPSDTYRIRGNTAQLALALLNLVDNAIRHAPVGSVVMLSGQLLDDGSFYFSVDDEGCGIEPVMLTQLLNPMLADTEEPRSDFDLTGMGLAVAKRIVEAHGGTLTIRSAVARGTTAIVHLPAERISVRNSEAA